MQVKDYYDILGIRPTGSADEIALAYKGRRTQYHPDKYSQADSETQKWATAKMQEVNEAYVVLSDVNRRGEYDAAYNQDSAEGRNEECQTKDQSNQSEDQDNESSIPQGKVTAQDFIARLQSEEKLAKRFMKEFNAIPMIAKLDAIDWHSIQVTSTPLSENIQKLVKKSKDNRKTRNAIIVLGAVGAMIDSHSYITWTLFISLHGLLFFNNPKQEELREREESKNIVDATEKDYQTEVNTWYSRARGNSAIDLKQTIPCTISSFGLTQYSLTLSSPFRRLKRTLPPIFSISFEAPTTTTLFGLINSLFIIFMPCFLFL